MASELYWNGHKKTTPYIHTMSVLPHTQRQHLISERMRSELKVSYDLLYNVSILATPHCAGQEVLWNLSLNYTMVSMDNKLSVCLIELKLMGSVTTIEKKILLPSLIS